MEIGFFSKCVKDLIVDLDRVDIPGLGVFFTEDVPSTVSDRGNTINPPQRRMFFKRQEVAAGDDNEFLLAAASALNVDLEHANVELQWCLSRINSELSGNRTCTLPGLGEMKSTNSGEYFFIPDEDLDICPESFGLDPVCVKMPEVQAPQEIQVLPEVQVLPETPPVRVPSDVKKTAPLRKRHTVRNILLVILAVIFAAIAAAVIFYFLCPEQADILLNSLLYTPEELEILGR